MPAIRLSTSFDSVTLYGEDPDYRPDIYGKIGNSGVSVCCLDYPAWDPDFNTADLLLLLPMSRIGARYARHFVEKRL